MANASTARYGAGGIAIEPGDPERAIILQRGLARAFITSADGRQATVGYFYRGDLIGGHLVMGADLTGAVQVITDSTLVDLGMANFRRLVGADASIAAALARDQAEQYAQAIRVAAMHAFGSVLQKVAFEVLERSSRSQLETQALQLSVSHQELADGVGSVRYVVGRALAQLSELGLIATGRQRVTVLDACRLEALAAAPYMRESRRQPSLSVVSAGQQH